MEGIKKRKDRVGEAEGGVGRMDVKRMEEEVVRGRKEGVLSWKNWAMYGRNKKERRGSEEEEKLNAVKEE